MSNNQVSKREKFYLDYSLIGILLLFMGTSLLAIYKSAAYLGYSTNGLVLRQAMWYGVGFVILFVLTRLGREFLYKSAKILYFILLLMMLVLIVVKYTPSLQGVMRPIMEQTNGAWSWYKVPGLGTFQPSEFMKICLIFISGDIIDKHNREIQQNGFLNDMKLFLKLGLWVIPPLLLNFLQPDTGVPIIVVVSLIFMIYVGNTKNYWFLTIMIGLVVLYFGIIYLFYNHPDILGNFFGSGTDTAYKLRRFYGWLEYEKYAQSDGYQLYNSLIAMGMGGTNGLVNPTFLVHISEAQNDFIFSVIGSQFGFMGSLFIIGIIILLNLKLIYTAITSIDSKSKYIIGGLIGIFMYQQLQNMSMMIGLLPITGITLPLISYGGSSLVSYMIGLSYPFMVHSHTKNNPIYEASRVPTKLEQAS